MTTPSFSDFLRERIGQNWVCGRRSKHVINRYGPDVVTLSPKRYRELEAQFEAETGFTADGQPSPTYVDRLRAINAELLAALQTLLLCQAPDGTKCAPNDSDLDLARAAIKRATE